MALHVDDVTGTIVLCSYSSTVAVLAVVFVVAVVISM